MINIGPISIQQVYGAELKQATNSELETTLIEEVVKAAKVLVEKAYTDGIQEAATVLTEAVEEARLLTDSEVVGDDELTNAVKEVINAVNAIISRFKSLPDREKEEKKAKELNNAVLQASENLKNAVAVIEAKRPEKAQESLNKTFDNVDKKKKEKSESVAIVKFEEVAGQRKEQDQKSIEEFFRRVPEFMKYSKKNSYYDNMLLGHHGLDQGVSCVGTDVGGKPLENATIVPGGFVLGNSVSIDRVIITAEIALIVFLYARWKRVKLPSISKSCPFYETLKVRSSQAFLKVKACFRRCISFKF